ncbi:MULTISPECIES: hypothetical protein [unclassified Flammeovirga]|uniref:hypothetical protein n=1 Tax=unclassified Flammeovirga TaxID=2637820 RepID=UPI0005C78AEC|nr:MULTISPECIES: hypothetical protein [unclassified Flammeovirga]KXX72489.1 hypothetical protein AVL50_00015 [Flammeovirga sp. SJP92]
MIPGRDKISNSDFIKMLNQNIHFDIKNKFIEEFKKGTVVFQKKQIAAMLNINEGSFNYQVRQLGYDSRKIIKRKDVIDILNELFQIDLLEED